MQIFFLMFFIQVCGNILELFFIAFVFFLSVVPGWEHHELHAAVWKCDIKHLDAYNNFSLWHTCRYTYTHKHTHIHESHKKTWTRACLSSNMWCRLSLHYDSVFLYYMCLQWRHCRYPHLIHPQSLYICIVTVDIQYMLCCMGTFCSLVGWTRINICFTDLCVNVK